MNYTVKVSLNDKDLYNFLIYHNYRGAQGKLGILVAILAFVAAVVTFGKVELLYTIIYAVCGVVFLVYIPLNLKFKSKKQFERVPEMKEEMTYNFSDEGITTSMQDQSVTVKWITLFKVIGTKNYLYIYSDRLHASILPKAAIQPEIYDGLVEFITLKTPKGKVKIK